MKSSPYSSVYAECVGYSFEQCYSSSVGITRYIENDEQHLAMLKELVKEFEQALEIVEIEEDLRWTISKPLREKIKAAAYLQEVY